MVKTGKLLRSLFRAGTSTAKLFAAVTAPPKPKRKRAAAKPRAKAAAVAKPAAAPRASRVCAPASSARTARAATPSAVAPGKWLSAQMPNAAGQRMSYWLYLPNHQPSEQGMPLVVMLHGCQQTATQFAQGTRMNLHAEKMGYAVLYPQQLVSSHPHRCWKWYDRATQEGGGDVQAIVAIIHQILTSYRIDRSRVYVAGISAGAGMANILALNYPGLFAGVGLHSGPVFGAGHNTIGALGVMKHGAAGLRADLAIQELLQRQPSFPGMPAILFQGEADHVVRPVNQVQLARQSMTLNHLSGPAKITEKQRYRLHDFYTGRKLMLRVARIEKLEHAWSGGDSTLAFNDRAGPNASKMMLDFFSRHRRV